MLRRKCSKNPDQALRSKYPFTKTIFRALVIGLCLPIVLGILTRILWEPIAGVLDHLFRAERKLDGASIIQQFGDVTGINVEVKYASTSQNGGNSSRRR